MYIIAKIKFGSHLYGTNTENSDTDYKGVYLPSLEDVLLGKIKKSISFGVKTSTDIKNSKDDVDFEVYSLHYFIQLAIEGQTVAIDMLHAPESMIEINSDIWKDICNHKHRFYTKNLESFVGYANTQAAKYGLKGSRLSDAKIVIDYLSKFDSNSKLSQHWFDLPQSEHAYYVEQNSNNIRQYQVCGKILQETVKIGYAKAIVEKYLSEYGKRAIEASENKNIDFKAVSHALRAAIQVKHILLEKNIKFPLKESKFLKRVKKGNLDYSTQISPRLEELIDEVKYLSKHSLLPEKADSIFWNSFIINIYKNLLK